MPMQSRNERKSTMEPKRAKDFLLSGFFILLVLCLVAADKSRTNVLSTCNGSIAECDKEGELFMESDISHRILEEHTHITYGVLKKDKPACESAGRGDSYRSCYPDPSGRYERGCSRIYRCRDSS